MDPRGEASLLYCRRCRWSQSICALFLCMLGIAAVVGAVLEKFGMFKFSFLNDSF
jgi:hypothetical protein